MKPFSGGRPRRRPWPYSAVINGIGVMLLEGQPDSPGLIGASPPPLGQVTPLEFSPSAQNPAVEGAHEWRDLSGGFGLRMQQGAHDHQYRYARRANCSIKDQIIFGPKINTLTPGTTAGITDFFEIDSSLYALAGRYVLVRAQSQTVTEGGSPTGGTFTLTYGAGTTSALAFDVSAAAMQTALRLLAGLESVTVTRTGTTTNFVWTIVMRGAGNSPSALTYTSSLTGGTPTLAIAISATTDSTGGWTVDKDLGSGKAALNVVVFHTNAGGGSNFAYIAMGATEAIWKFDGTTYTQSSEALYSRG